MLKVHAKTLGSVAVLSLQGQIVIGENETLRTAVQSLTKVSTIKLDFTRITAVDAGGLGTMLALREQLASKGVRLELANVNRLVGKVLRMARLDSVFQLKSANEFVQPASRSRKTSALRLASCA